MKRHFLPPYFLLKASTTGADDEGEEPEPPEPFEYTED